MNTDNLSNENEATILRIVEVMPRCSTCKFWKQNTFYVYEGAENDGFCSELTIELKTGWDGAYVDSIETKSTFGCVFHN